MTVTTTSNTTAPMAGDGSNASWPFTFSVQDSSQIEVVVRNSAGTETVLASSLYSVALTNSGRSGGTVTYPLGSSRLTASDYLVVRRSVPITQPTNLRNQGSLAPETLESIADRAVYQIQQVADDADRALKIARTDTGTLNNLPTATARAGKYLFFDDDGQPAVSTAVTETGSFTQSGTGAVARTIAARLMETVSVKDFGALGDGSSDDTAEIQAALDSLEGEGGVVFFPAGHYVVTATLRVPDGVTLEGAGVGLWDVVFHDRDKTWEGTNLLFKGTGAKNHSFYGITSGIDNGGTVTVSGVTAKLLSFMNADSTNATRATAKAFSVAIKPKTANGSRHWGLRNLRIVPHDTTNGLAEYSDETSTSLGDDWDVGVLLQDSEYVRLENVQVVGYWRMAGLLIATAGLDDYGRSERNRFVDCKFQGFTGVAIRATDLWKVTGTTVNTLTVQHNAEHYWPSSGAFESTESGTNFTYTGLSYSAPSLTFTGVSPDPTGKTQIRALKRGSGMAGTQFIDCLVHGLDHVSGVVATSLGFANPSKALEISGFPIRGLQFFNTKFQTDEAVCAHFHECDDTLMFGAQFETGGTGHMIASPVESSSTATAPSGHTLNLRWYATAMSSVTTTGFTPRTLFDDWRTLNSKTRANSNFLIEPLAGQDVQVRLVSGQNFYVNDSSNVGRFRVTETGNVLIQNGGQLSLTGGTAYVNVDASQNLNVRNGTTNRLQLFGSSGNWGAGADNAQTWGTSGFRWSTIYAGTGTINTSDAREKTDVEDADLGLAFVQSLRPVSYKLVDGTSGRTHYGLIAQEVEEALAAAGKSNQDFAGFVRSPLQDADGNDTGEVRYGLRYEELIAPILRSIQELAARLAKLED